MTRRILYLACFLALAHNSGFSQKPYKGLTPGKSTRAEVERLLGRPVGKVSETLIEYRPQPLSEYNPQPLTGKIYAQYRVGSPVVDRIEVLCDSNSNCLGDMGKNCLYMLVQPYEAAVHKFPAPEATAYEGKGTDKEKQIEYFGKPYYAVRTLILKNGNVAICTMGFYSPELYQAALPKSK
jgi:hypothetical protein